MSTPRTSPGRRSAARRTGVNVTTVLAVLLPLVAAGGLLLVRPESTTTADHPPTETALTRATLVCPGALDDDPGLTVTTDADNVSGTVDVGLGDESSKTDLTSGEATTIDQPDAVAVTGLDELAPGLAAARTGGNELATSSCLPPASHQWFTGVGAGAGHRSILELTNPDQGTALVDVTLLGPAGVVDAPRLRGVSVRGHDTVRLELGKLVPQRGELALDVRTVRGRIGASLLDTLDRVGSSPRTRDWLPGQAEPATGNLLMGMAPGTDGRRTLAIANGGDDEVRASIRIVTRDSVFAPEGVPDVRIPPQSVKRVTLSAVLADAIKDGALGLSVTASAPVTTTLRSEVADDLSQTTPGMPITGTAIALLPPGAAQGRRATTKVVDLAGADRTGTVTVVSRAADGTELDRTEVDITPDHGVRVKLPRTAVLVTVTAARAQVTGSVLVTGRAGAAVVPLVEPVHSGLVPDVRRGLP